MNNPMKNVFYILLYSLMLLVTACEKDTMPEIFAPNVTTGTATDIYRKGATLSGSIDNVETVMLDRYGILFSELKSMVEYDEFLVATGEKEFDFLVQDLKPNTTYYFCAFAHSGYSMVKGEIRSFTTSESNAPVFSALEVLNSDVNNISLSTTILDDGGSELMLTGFCWIEGEEKQPTFIDHIKNVSAENSKISVTLSDLLPSTVYRIRAYAATSKGVGYSETVTVRTDDVAVPLLSSVTAIDSTAQSITVSSHVFNSDSTALTEVGFCYSSDSQTPNKDEHSIITTEISSGHNHFEAIIDGLVAGTTYYIRAYASNEFVTGYSDTFTYTPRKLGIYTLEDLLAFREVSKTTEDFTPWKDENGVVNIYADLDLDSISNWEPIERIPDGIILDGNGYTIDGMKMTCEMSSSTHYGFIRSNYGTVRNLNLGNRSSINFTIEKTGNSMYYHGALCAYNWGTISDCISAVEISSTLSDGLEATLPDSAPAAYVAGICGLNTGKILRCTNKGDITGSWHCIGIVGSNNGLVQECQNYGTITGVVFSQSISGIGGCSENGSIMACTNYGRIVGNSTNYVGGISGGIYGIVENCSNEGEISGSGISVGGIVGDMYHGATIQNCTNIGTITNDGNNEQTTYYGGIVGWIRANFDGGDSVHTYQNNQNSGIVLEVEGNDKNAIGRDDRVGE